MRWFVIGAVAALVADHLLVQLLHTLRRRRWQSINGIHPVSKETLAALRRLVEKGARVR